MYSCDCGAIKKTILNDVLTDLNCPVCGTKLKNPKKISEQTKLGSYLSLDENDLVILRQKIFQSLMSAEGTDRELTERLGYTDPNKIRPRRFELVDMGLAENKYKRPCRVSGKKSIVWGAC